MYVTDLYVCVCMFCLRLRKRLESQAAKKGSSSSRGMALRIADGQGNNIAQDNDHELISEKDMEKILANFEDEMERDYCLRQRILRNSQNSKCSNKGPRPTHEDLKKWAPAHFFVHAASGNLAGLMHKMGMFRMRINYGVASVSRYLFDYLKSTLKSFMNDVDQNAAGRYFESIRCRMVTETVHKTMFMSMATCEDLDAAVVNAISALTNNAMHLSLVPVMVERFLQRIVQYEPVLGMNMLGIYMGVPVVSMSSILQLMNGQPVTNEEEREAMRKFVEGCISSNNAVQYLGMDGFQSESDSAAAAAVSGGGGGNLLPGYVTCTFLRDNFVQAQGGPGGGGQGFSRGFPGSGPNMMMGGGGGGGGGGASTLGNMSAQGIPLEPIQAIIRKMYEENSKVECVCVCVSVIQLC